MSPKPEVVAIKGGWAALGDGWAVFGASEEEALLNYTKADERRKEIRSRSTLNAETTEFPRLYERSQTDARD